MRRMLLGCVFLYSFGSESALAAPGAADLDQAALDADRRDRELIAGFATRLTNDTDRCKPDPWPVYIGDHTISVSQAQVTYLTAMAYMLAHPGDFSNGWQATALALVNTWCPALNPPQPLPGDPPVESFRDRLVNYLRTIRVMQPEDGFGKGGSYGTEGDYDMTLMALVNVLYTLTLEDTILGDPQKLKEAAVGILCQNGGDPNAGCEYSGDPANRPEVEWDGMNAFLAFGLHAYGLGSYFTYWYAPELPIGLPVMERPETENHVLLIYGWNYLVSMWILRMGLDPSQGMDYPIEDWAYEGLAWLEQDDNMERFFSPILQALGRVVPNGFFETNARPYQRVSLFAILTLAIYGDIFSDLPLPPDRHAVPDRLVHYAKLVRQAARNAMHYASATFAFQSLRAKRSAPNRRRADYRDVWDFYSHNDTAFLFGLLSGAHEYDDCTDPANPSCELLASGELGGSKASLLWAALGRLSAREQGRSGYELPRAIHGHFFDSRNYFAILQARASLGQYRGMGTALYFEPDDPTVTQLPERWKGSPELYFGTGDLMLSAGGMFDLFYDADALPYWSADLEYAFISRATMLIPRGDFGKPYNGSNPRDDQWKDLYDASRKDVLVMRGRREAPYRSDCNVWTYKSFAYGYNFDASVKADWAEGWPQHFPDKWKNEPHRRVQIDETPIDVYYLGPGVLGPGVGSQTEGYYLIVGRLRKDGAGNPFKWWFYNYQRGFIEVVPGYLYPTIDALESELRSWNEPFRYLSANDDEDRRPFRYVTMTTHERLTLDPKMGADPKIGPVPDERRPYCRDGIRKIEALADPGSGPAGSNDDARWLELDRHEHYIPKQIRNDGERRSIPLARVWELDEQYQRTDRMFMEVLDHGRLAIRWPNFFEHRLGDHLLVRLPSWDCLYVDSHDHTLPFEQERLTGETTPVEYSNCFASGYTPYRVRTMATGGTSACAVTSGGELYCWGSNSLGQLGTGNNLPSSSPRQVLHREHEEVAPLGHNQAVAVGRGHACALQTDGAVHCFGGNANGELGDGTTADRNAAGPEVMRDMDDPLRAAAISAGAHHTCALGQDGEVFCWGANHAGQVGHSLGAAPIEPWASEVDLPERAVAVSAGGYHSCAILAGGMVYCWGANDHGQLGDGTFAGGPDPTQVAFPPDLHFASAMEVSAGAEHTCAIFRAGYNIRRTACWGRNNTLQLGTNLVEAGVDSPVPLRLTAFGPQGNTSAEIVSISAGGGHTCARDVENAVSCWGSNWDGELGSALAPSPTADAVEVLGLSPATRLLGRGSVARHACAVDQLDQLRCWGSHRYGQLGTGEPADMAPHYDPSLPAWP